VVKVCENPRPDSQSGNVCAINLQTEDIRVVGRRPKTEVEGDCPQCIGADGNAVRMIIVS
jgi:hypothetical protein